MRACAWFVGLAVLAGCNSGGDTGRYVPPESSARQAVEAALTHWKDGATQPGELSVGSQKVQVVDQAWAGGLKLQGFEITSEETGSGGPRVFNVKLKTARGEQVTKYYVVGIDPLWVYAEPDYKKLIGS